MSIIKKHPNLVAVFLGAVLCVILIVLAEFSLCVIDHFIPGDTRKVESKNAKNYFRYDEFSIQLPREGKHNARKWYTDTGEEIYNVTYSIDEYGLRIVPVNNREARNKFIILAGCSFTFGEGVEDNETLPYHIGTLAPDYMPYNYSFHGWGPFNIMAKLDNYDIRSQINEQDGIMIYTFIDGHIQRVLGSISVIDYVKKHPFYYRDQEGNFIRNGSFKTAKPILTRLYLVLQKSKIIKKLGVDLPPKSHYHIQFVADSIGAIQKRFLKQFPNGRFYVNIRQGTESGKPLMSYLDKMNIPYVDTYELFAENDPIHYISEGDKHPNTLANHMVAEKLVTALDLN